MEAVVTTVIGLAGGLGLSALWWYWLAHKVQPTMEFGTGISRLVTNSGDTVYRVKIGNTSKRRGVIDVVIYGRIHFPGVSPYLRVIRGTTVTMGLKISNGHVLRIGPASNTFVTFRMDDALNTAEASRILHTLFPITTQRVGLTLEGLLMRSHGAYVRIGVLCFDEWSGSRKYFSSQKYGHEHIAEGVFRGFELVPD